MDFTQDKYLAPRTIEKIKILGALPIQPIYLKSGPNWQSCLAGSSRTAPRILIFSIVMGAKYLSYVKFIATFALIFFGYIILVLSRVTCKGGRESAFGRHM